MKTLLVSLALFGTAAGAQVGGVLETLNAEATSAQPLFAPGNWDPDIIYWDFAFVPDGRTLFFGTGSAEGENRTILMHRWDGSAWLPVEKTPFTVPEAAEGTPVMSGNGEWLYFSSDRQVSDEPENTRRELYRTSRESGWTEVQRLTNTPLYGEVTLSTSRGSKGFLWTDRRLDGARQMGLYEVDVAPDGTLSGFVDRTDLHTGDPSGENYTWLSPDGEFALFLNYNISGGDTEEDIFLIRKNQDGWTAPVGLGPGVNTDVNEGSPSLSADGRFLFWGAKRGDTGPYHYIPVSALTLFKPAMPVEED